MTALPDLPARVGGGERGRVKSTFVFRGFDHRYAYPYVVREADAKRENRIPSRCYLASSLPLSDFSSQFILDRVSQGLAALRLYLTGLLIIAAPIITRSLMLYTRDDLNHSHKRLYSH